MMLGVLRLQCVRARKVWRCRFSPLVHRVYQAQYSANVYPNHYFGHSACFYQTLLARRSLKHWQRVCFRVEYPPIEGQRILVQAK
jgi:hypothetical protein